LRREEKNAYFILAYCSKKERVKIKGKSKRERTDLACVGGKGAERLKEKEALVGPQNISVGNTEAMRGDEKKK